MKLDILIAVAQQGGVENVINMTALDFKKRGWDVRVIQLVWEGFSWVAEEIPFFPLLEGRNGHDLEELVQAYAEFLHKNGVPQAILAVAWPYMCYVGKKAALLNQTEITVLSWLHAPVQQYRQAGFGGYESLSIADGHLAISSRIGQDIKNHGGGLVQQIHNPVDFGRCAVKRQKKNGMGRTLFYAGRLSAEKHIETMIWALGKTKDPWELHLLGDGNREYKDFLMQTAKESQVSGRIRWYGWKENPWVYAGEADAFVLASEYEGFPLAAIEAQANGIPVIATPVSGITDLLKPGVNGFLFPIGDAGALAEILDAMSSGALPSIDPEICQNAVSGFRMEYALADLSCKLKEMVYRPKQFSAGLCSDVFLYSGEKISVIVPCHNVELYIRDCLESLLRQTMPLELLELILIDDASVDRTFSILTEYEAAYPDQILLISCDKNIGPGAARNLGMQYASGDYLIFVDADDLAQEDLFTQLYEKIVLYQCDFVECAYYMFSEQGKRKSFEKPEAFYDMKKREDKRRYMLAHGCQNAIWAKIYRREFLRENKILFPEGILMEDIYFHQMCMMYADRCYVLSEMLYAYRYNPNSIMHHKAHSAYVMDGFWVQEKTYQELKKRGKLDGYLPEMALLYYVKGFVGPVSEMDLENADQKDRDNIRMIQEALWEHFPDLLENAYILADASEYNQKFLALLRQP